MKNSAATVYLLLISLMTLGQSKVKSFYFDLNHTEPTHYSSIQFEQFKKSLSRGQIHVIEINSFTDSTGTSAGNDSIARNRLNYIASRLNLNYTVKLNAYGLERPYTLPKAISSRRVDIIYEMGPRKITPINTEKDSLIEPEVIQIEEVKAIEEQNNVTETAEVNYDKTAEIKESFEANIPFIINVQFKEGTAKILPVSYREVTRVAQFLKENPQLKAEIRGHVCCGNNMRISKKRAKSVYKRLITIGIAKERLSYSGRSNTEPLVFPEVSESDRQKNRRVDVKFSKID